MCCTRHYFLRSFSQKTNHSPVISDALSASSLPYKKGPALANKGCLGSRTGCAEAPFAFCSYLPGLLSPRLGTLHALRPRKPVPECCRTLLSEADFDFLESLREPTNELPLNNDSYHCIYRFQRSTSFKLEGPIGFKLVDKVG